MSSQGTRRALGCAYAAAMICALAGSPARAQRGYTIDVMPTLGGIGSRVGDINEHGQVVGTVSDRLGRSRAVTWEDGVLTDLGTLPGGFRAFGNGINDHGMVVGESGVPGGASAFVMWSGGEVIDLGHLGRRNGQALRVNNAGWVVGWGSTKDGEQSAFLWRDGRIEDLGTLGGGASNANGINARGEVVGWSINQSGDRRAFLWRDGRMTALFDSEATAFDINDAGLVVGDARGSPFLWKPGTLTILPKLSDLYGWATGINNRGQIVGLSAIRSDAHAVLWEEGRIIDLNDFLHPCTVLDRLDKAEAINDRGQIVGNGSFSSFGRRFTRGFLLTPMSCGDIIDVRARCGSRGGKLKATVKTALPAGHPLTLINNLSDCRRVRIGENGRARATWKDATGHNQVIVAECPDLFAEADCD